MKRVLWISRHALTLAQYAGLERFCGDSIAVTCHRETVEDIRVLAGAVARADVIAAVLPVHLLARLVRMAGQRPVLVSVARRQLIPGPGPEPSVVFTHGLWLRIRRLELDAEALPEEPAGRGG